MIYALNRYVDWIRKRVVLKWYCITIRLNTHLCWLVLWNVLHSRSDYLNKSCVIMTFLFVEVWQDVNASLWKGNILILLFLKHDGLTFQEKNCFKHVDMLFFCFMYTYMVFVCLAKSRCCESALSSPVWRSQPSKPSVTEVSKFIVIYEYMVTVYAQHVARIIDGQCATKH